MSDFIEIKFDNQEVERRLQEIAEKSSNLRPLMKNIAGIFASAAEDNFAEEGRPDKWIDLSEVTKKQRKKLESTPDRFSKLQVSSPHQLILITIMILPLLVQT